MDSTRTLSRGSSARHASSLPQHHLLHRAGTIATVLKKSGDAVAENEVIAQIETDKVTIDIKAPSEGTILGVVVQEQDTVVPGQLVATLDDAVAKVGAGAAATLITVRTPFGGHVANHTQLLI